MNIATVGDVDSGKTTLTDLLMFLSMEDQRAARGSIEEGTTRTDIGAVEVARVITINSVPVQGSFLVGGNPRKLTIVDTPGHKEFGYQVRTAISGLEGALYLVDMTKPFRSHSAELLYTVREAGLPVIAVLNKIDIVDEFSYQRVMGQLLDSMEDYGIRLQLLQSPAYKNSAAIVVNDALLGMHATGLKKGHVPDLSEIVIASQLEFHDAIPAILTSGAKGIGANELLAYIFGLFHPQPSPQPQPQQDSLQIRVINRLPRPIGGGSVVAMVSAGELRKGARIANPFTGEYYKLSRICGPNGTPVRTASSGNIVLLGDLDNTKLATGHVLGAQQAVNNWQKLPQPLVGVELSSPETHKMVEALKMITRWDPSWKYEVLHKGVMAYASGTFHLGVLVDILRQEFKIPVTAKPFEPRYVARPEEAPDVEGCVFKNGESYIVVIGERNRLSKASQNAGPEKKELEKMTRQLNQYVAGLKWFGRFPIEDLDVVVKEAFSPTRKASQAVRQQALEKAVQKLLYESNAMALYEPYINVNIRTKTELELQHTEDWFKRFPQASITTLYKDTEYIDWPDGIKQSFPYETLITIPVRKYLQMEVEISKLAKDSMLRLRPEKNYESVPFGLARQILLQTCGKTDDEAATMPVQNSGRRQNSHNGYYHDPHSNLRNSLSPVYAKTLQLQHGDGAKLVPQVQIWAALPGVVVPYDPAVVAGISRQRGSRR